MRRMSMQTLRNMSSTCASILMSFVRMEYEFFFSSSEWYDIVSNINRSAVHKFCVPLCGRM